MLTNSDVNQCIYRNLQQKINDKIMFNWLEWNIDSVGNTNITALVRPHLSTVQPIATDRLAWSVCLSVCLSLYHDCGLCRNAWTDRDAIQDIDSYGSKEPCVRWVSRSLEGAILRAKMGRSITCPDMWSKWLSRGQNRYGADADWRLLEMELHWRHLTSTTEPSVCSGDTALCQITLTFDHLHGIRTN